MSGTWPDCSAVAVSDATTSRLRRYPHSVRLALPTIKRTASSWTIKATLACSLEGNVFPDLVVVGTISTSQ